MFSGFFCAEWWAEPSGNLPENKVFGYTQYDQYRPINTVQFGGLVQIGPEIPANSQNFPKNTGQICKD